MTLKNPKKIAVIDDNLFFSARLRDALRNLGLEPCMLAPDQTVEDDAGSVILNLSAKGLDAAAVIRRIKRSPEVLVIGFGRHTDADVLDRAREAGCDIVTTNGRLFADLESLLQEAGLL